MLVENQLVEVKWNGQNRKRYEQLGYNFTKIGDTFLVKAEDLNHSNKTISVKVKCDYCGKIYETKFASYFNGIKTINKSCCDNQECKNKKSSDVQLLQHRERQYSKFVKLCEERGYIPISTIDDYKNSHTKLKYMCPKHGVRESTLTNFSYGSIGCLECSKEKSGSTTRIKTPELISLIASKNNDEVLNPQDYINTKTKNLKIRCGSCNQIFITSYGAFANSSGKCRGCATHDRCKMNVDDVIGKVQQHNNSILLNPEDYYNVNTKNLKIRCGLCGTEYISTLANLENSSNACPKCSNRICVKLSIEDVLLRVNAKNNNILLNPEEYTGIFDKNLKIKCGSCGNIFITSLVLLEGSYSGKCKKCSPISIGEEMIAKALDKYNVTYTRQEHFNGDCRDIKPLPFDFFIPDYNYCCEFDGLHHMEPIYGEERFRNIKLHDAMKDWYCRWNNINLLRIPYWERENIESILVNTFNLTLFNSKQNYSKIKYIPNRKTA